MTGKKTKLLLGLLLAAGCATVLVTGKMAQCELGLPACQSSLADDYMLAMREPLMPSDAVAGTMASATAVVDSLLELINLIRDAR